MTPCDACAKRLKCDFAAVLNKCADGTRNNLVPRTKSQGRGPEKEAVLEIIYGQTIRKYETG